MEKLRPVIVYGSLSILAVAGGIMVADIKEKREAEARHQTCDFSVETKGNPSSKELYEALGDSCRKRQEIEENLQFAEEKLKCLSGEDLAADASYAEKDARVRYCARLLSQ